MSLVLAILVFLTLLGGAIIKGAVGLGLPMIAIPVLSLVIGVPQALAIVAIPMAVTNAWQVWQFRGQRGEVGFLRWFLLVGMMGIAAGTWLLSRAPGAVLDLGLGAVVMVYLVMRLTRPQFRLSEEATTKLAPAMGLGAGLLQGATGLSGVVGATYFHSIGLTRGAFMFCVASMFLLFTSVQLPLLVTAGIASRETSLYGLFALLPAALGLVIGNAIAKRLRPQVFDWLVLAVLVAAALPLIWRGVTSLL